MNAILYFLLIGGISVMISALQDELNYGPLRENDIEKIIKKDGKSLTGKKGHELKLLTGGKLGETYHALVWKGIYNKKDKVAVKIVWQNDSMEKEMKIFQALNATNDLDIEKKGIARVFYYGPFLTNYHAIVMSLFEETLEDRYKLQNQHISDLSILLIFKRTIEILRYFNSKKIVHNDIKPENIFLRGSEIFIGDFDAASLDGETSFRGTRMFASSTTFGSCGETVGARSAMDDLESLIYSIWYVDGVPMGRLFGRDLPEGYALLKSKNDGTAESRMLEKCSHFENESIRKVFKLVCVDELLSGKKVPNYERIIDGVTNAIAQIRGKSRIAEFEWLLKVGVRKPVRFSTLAKIVSCFTGTQ